MESERRGLEGLENKRVWRGRRVGGKTERVQAGIT